MTTLQIERRQAAPCLRLHPEVPRGEDLKQWTIARVREAFSESLPPDSRLLTTEDVHFADLAAVTARERSERDPRERLIYQVLRASGVPAEYLDTTLMPMASRLEGVGVYWNPLARQPALWIDQAYADALASPDAGVRLGLAAMLGDNLIRILLDVLPEPRPVESQQVPNARETIRDRLTHEFTRLSERFEGVVDGQRLKAGLEIISDLLDAGQARFYRQGGRLFLCFEGAQAERAEYDLGGEFQLGLVYTFGEPVYTRFMESIYLAFLRQFKRPGQAQNDIRMLQYRAQQTLREIGLRSRADAYEAYINSEIPLYYWGACSRRINPWQYLD